jgi:hypothetical protein
MCIESNYGPVCACREGFRLYDDLRTCVLTEELLEDAVEEMSEDLALPIAIVLIVGFLVILCMAIVTWYCVTRDSTVTVVTVLVQKFSFPTHAICECVGGKYLNQSKDTQSYRSNSSTKPIGQVIRSYNKPLHISIV